MNYTEINRVKWNQWSSENCVWTRAITHEEFCKINSKSPIYLTPTKPVPYDWYAPLKGKKVLGLACGGGQQCPIFAALGADVTVVDISESQLSAEHEVSKREGYSINLVHRDITLDFPFASESFDLIFHPVANSYIDNIQHVWNESYRILKHNGVLLSGFANPTIYLYKLIGNETELAYSMPFNPLKDIPSQELQELVRTDGVQFGHSFSSQINGQLKAGFVLSQFFEDYHPSDNSINNYETEIGKIASILTKYMPIYFATKSIKL